MKISDHELLDLKQRINQWRLERASVRMRMPEDFWQTAVSLTKKYSVSKVASELHMSYEKLKKKTLNSRGVTHTSNRKSKNGFIEITGNGIDKLWTRSECEIEISRKDGAKMYMRCGSDQLLHVMTAFLEGYER